MEPSCPEGGGYTSQFVEQVLVATGVVKACTAITSGSHTRPTIESVHLQTGIVGDTDHS